MPALPLRVHDAPPAPRPLPERNYFSQVPHELTRLTNAGEIACLDNVIVQNLMMDAPSFGATKIRRTIESLAEAMGVTDDTIRAGVKRLEKAGVLTRERDRTIPGSPYVFTLHRPVGLALKADEQAEVHKYSGTRKGDHTSYDKRKCNPERNRRCNPEKNRRCNPERNRSPSLFSRESLEREKTTTTAPVDPPQVGAREADRLLLSSPPPIQARESEVAPEAPGSPQGDRRGESARSHRPASRTAPRASQPFPPAALDEVAKAFPDVPRDGLDSWCQEARELWAEELERREDAVVAEDCVRAVVLAAEYARRMGEKDGSPRTWGYVVAAIERWCHRGWSLDTAEATEVEPLRPKVKRAVAPPAEAERTREKPRGPSPAMETKIKALNKAWDAHRNGKPDAKADAKAEIDRLTTEMEQLEAEESAAAQEEGRRGGVSPYPPAGPETLNGQPSMQR